MYKAAMIHKMIQIQAKDAEKIKSSMQVKLNIDDNFWIWYNWGQNITVSTSSFHTRWLLMIAAINMA